MTKQIRNFIGAALLLAAVSACAQSVEAMRVKVPFSFTTAGKTWPAAEYKVQIREGNGTLTLSAPGISSATMLTTNKQWLGGKQTSLQFRCANDRCVLQNVNLNGVAHSIVAGKPEKRQAAVQSSSPETTVASSGTTLEP